MNVLGCWKRVDEVIIWERNLRPLLSHPAYTHAEHAILCFFIFFRGCGVKAVQLLKGSKSNIASFAIIIPF
jgi:hypothetical protein